jgi:hypothetical protein
MLTNARTPIGTYQLEDKKILVRMAGTAIIAIR